MKKKLFWRDFGEGYRLFNLFKNNVGKQLILFDTETSGLSAETDRIIQISAIKGEIVDDFDFEETDRLNLYINPGFKISKKITEITGITNEQLQNEKLEEDVWPTIYNFFDGVDILCGHNAKSFDMKMLRALYARQNTDCREWNVLDTMTLARELHHKDEAGSHKLGDLAAHFGLDYGLTFHNSMDDVIATMRLLQFFIEEYKEKELSEEGIDESRMKTKVRSCWHYSFTSRVPNATKEDGSPKYRKNFRLYVRVAHQNRLLYISQNRPYEWGCKERGSLTMFDMEDIEKQVLALYKCETLEELSRVRDSRSY